MTGNLLGIATKPASRAPMALHDLMEISVESGLAGDFRGKSRNRQVTLLFEADWDKICKISGGKIGWEQRRANLLIGGMDNPRSAGGIFTIGEVSLLVTGETEPCNRMNQAFPGLKMLLTPAWRGGITCKVVQGGTVRVGDHVSYANEPRP